MPVLDRDECVAGPDSRMVVVADTCNSLTMALRMYSYPLRRLLRRPLDAVLIANSQFETISHTEFVSQLPDHFPYAYLPCAASAAASESMDAPSSHRLLKSPLLTLTKLRMLNVSESRPRDPIVTYLGTLQRPKHNCLRSDRDMASTSPPASHSQARQPSLQARCSH